MASFKSLVTLAPPMLVILYARSNVTNTYINATKRLEDVTEKSGALGVATLKRGLKHATPPIFHP